MNNMNLLLEQFYIKMAQEVLQETSVTNYELAKLLGTTTQAVCETKETLEKISKFYQKVLDKI